MKYLIKCSYDGSKFYGFQRLNDLDTVQKRLEEALSIINKEPVIVKGAGRTDKGVHALSQGVSFSLNYDIEPSRLRNAINSLVRPYINVIDVRVVDEDFHARFSVLEKKYVYKINVGKFNIFDVDYIYQLNRELNVDKMREAATYLLGVHDFRNYVSGDRDKYVNQISSIDFSMEEDILTITFVGKSFYRYMVRNLVGVLIQVGLNKLDVNEVKDRLENLDKEFTYYTAPACGLYLFDIVY
ncbi:MAG: tRNA pseudouridine(38-40) synthase TruA [Bacilli bacterium]|nr:tRNA pseudouridine(38-40) synthase TruA [Bacilli bacterium]